MDQVSVRVALSIFLEAFILVRKECLTRKSVSDLKLLFVHVGKTGGTTIDKVLRSNCDYYRYGGNEDSRKGCITELCCSDDKLLLSKLTKKSIHMFIPVRELKQKFSSHDVLWSIRNRIRM